MKYFLIICTIITGICHFPNLVHGYAINVTPQNIETYVYEMPQLLAPDEALSARGSDYIEIESYSHDYNQHVRFGSAVNYHTQKSYNKDKITTKAYIHFDTWAYSEPDSFFETNHYFNCYYNFNIFSEFPEYNQNDHISITSHMMPMYYHLGEIKLYDDSSHLIYQSDDYIGFNDIQLTLGKDYYMDIEYYINHLLEDDVDMRDTLSFSLVEHTPVPEPSSWLLFGIGLLALAGVGRKKILSAH